MSSKLIISLDFGSDSVRAVLVATPDCLRTMEQHFLDKPQLFHRECKIARCRLCSVMQDLIYIACKVVKHAGYIWLSFGRDDPLYRIFKELYA